MRTDPKFSQDVVPLSDLKVNPGKVVHQVDQTHRPVLLTSRGRGVAVIQALSEYEAESEERSFMRDVVAGLMDLEAGRESHGQRRGGREPESVGVAEGEELRVEAHDASEVGAAPGKGSPESGPVRPAGEEGQGKPGRGEVADPEDAHVTGGRDVSREVAVAEAACHRSRDQQQGPAR